jgi:hypothetical protein
MVYYEGKKCCESIKLHGQVKVELSYTKKTVVSGERLRAIMALLFNSV